MNLWRGIIIGRVKRCCCCVPIKYGAKIIIIWNIFTYLGIIANLIMFMLFNVSQDHSYLTIINNFPIASGNYKLGFYELKEIAI